MRLATIHDMPFILDMAEKFHGQSNWRDYIEFDYESLQEALTGLIIEGNGCVVIHDHGVLAGIVQEHWWNKHKLIAQELFWYADKNGMALLKGFEEWAKAKGAVVCSMGYLHNLRPKAIERAYRMHGYKTCETFCLKEL